MSGPIRVLIADDQALLRGSFRVLIETTPGLEVVGEAGDGAQAVRLARELVPDVVLMDLRMPVLDGIEATGEICSDPALAGVRILVLTMFDLDDYVYPALRAGASGFLLKDASPPDLIRALQVVASGEAVLAPSTTRRMIATFARPDPVERPSGRLVGLTPREHEVLVLVSDGLSNAQIGERLTISLPTVKTHVSNLLAKLHARDRAQLVIIAYEGGVATPGMPG
ncbi:MAG: hypothetical protein QG608_1620 [Actinomycetota bacterium]|nr:hypothetical protein [Actinomycetota bacterium]